MSSRTYCTQCANNLAHLFLPPASVLRCCCCSCCVFWFEYLAGKEACFHSLCSLVNIVLMICVRPLQDYLLLLLLLLWQLLVSSCYCCRLKVCSHYLHDYISLTHTKVAVPIKSTRVAPALRRLFTVPDFWRCKFVWAALSHQRLSPLVTPFPVFCETQALLWLCCAFRALALSSRRQVASGQVVVPFLGAHWRFNISALNYAFCLVRVRLVLLLLLDLLVALVLRVAQDK